MIYTKFDSLIVEKVNSSKLNVKTNVAHDFEKKKETKDRGFDAILQTEIKKLQS